MKASDEKREHETREYGLLADMAKGRSEHGRRVPPQPVRDDRGEDKSWRPSERK